MLDAHKNRSGRPGTQRTEGIFSEGLWRGVTIVGEASGCINRCARARMDKSSKWDLYHETPGCRDRAGMRGRGALLEDSADAQGRQT